MRFSDLDFVIHKNVKYTIHREICVNSFSSILPSITIKTFPKIKKASELNFFRKIHISEPQHSQILGDLLNPFGTHGQGDTFLRLFFQTLNLEFNEKDFWTISIESERFDIRIATKSRDKIIIIENKSNNAVDQPNQLYRYWYYGIYSPQKKFPENNNCWNKILYLSPSDLKTPSEQTLSRPCNFSKDLPEKVPINIDVLFFNNEIEKWLSKCLEAVKSNLELYYFIKQYYDFWRY